jgi:hypothetical protein
VKRALVFALALGPLLGGCAAAPKAWQRGELARAEMSFASDPLLGAYRDHLYMSKEQASGGAGAGGGGCGCAN